MAILMPTTVTVTLTNDQIIHLPTTAVEIVAAPGTGKVLVPITGTLLLDTTAGAYIGVTNASLNLMLGPTRYVSAIMLTAFALAQTTKTFGQMITGGLPDISTGDFDGEIVTNLGDPLTEHENLAITLKDDWDGVPDYTGGHADNTLKVTVLYVVIDV